MATTAVRKAALQRVKQERFKFQLRMLMENATKEEVDPAPVLQAALAEINGCRNAEAIGEDDELGEVESEIDELYEQIWAVVDENGGKPELEFKVSSLRARLRELQEKEVDAWKARFRSELNLDPDEGVQIVGEARALLERYR